MDAVIVPGLALDRAALDRARFSRDVRFDGRFFIAVISTGIYCRPICPTPCPKSHNVRYYATAAAASEAGFRPCLRCRPEAAPSSPAWLGVSAVVRRALRLIEEGALDEGGVTELAERLGIGSRYLRRLFVKHVGASPLAVAQTRRLHFAKRLIDETELPMTEVALESGYGSLRRFNAAFHDTYGRPPSDLRRCRGGKAAKRRKNRCGSIVLRLAYRPPYDWQGVLNFLAAQAVPEIEHVGRSHYARTIVHEGKPAHIVIRSPREVDAIELEFHGEPGGALFNLVNRARRMFDLAVDPLRIAAALGRDPLLAPLVKNRPGLRIPGVWHGFECAERAVLGQGFRMREQRLVSRLVRCCGSRIASPMAAGGSLTHLFPTAQSIAVANLENIGLAGSQIVAVKALAMAYLMHRVNFDAPAAELIRDLVALPDINDNIAEYIALRALGEPDAFPAPRADYFRKRAGVGRLDDSALAERSQSWRPWRGYAALYLWPADKDVQARRKTRRVSAL